MSAILSTARSLVFLVLVVALGYGAVRLLAPASVPLPLAPPAAVRPASTSPVAIPTGRFDLTLTAADLTRAAASAGPQTFAGVTVRDPLVRINGGRVFVTATAQLAFLTSRLDVVGTPAVAGGRIAVRVDSVQLGGNTAPEPLRAAVRDSLQSALDTQVPPNVRVTKLTVGDGVLSIEGDVV